MLRFSIFIFSLFLLSSQVFGLVVFDNKQAFLNATNAIEHQLPSSGSGTFAVGTLTVSQASGFTGIFNSLTPHLPLHIGISDLEHLDVNINEDTTVFGFDFVEPNLDGNLGGPFVDSTFTVTLFDDNVAQDSFTFNAPNDTLAFVGVTAEFDFDRVEIRETIGGVGNEFYGSFFTGNAVPEPSTIVMLISSLLLFGVIHRPK